MLLSQKQGIDDLIVESLSKNPYSSGPFLVKLVQKGRPNTTKQAVYVALKTLLENEVVAKVGTTYFLSRVWVGKLDHLFETKEKAELARDAIFDLGEQESISYHFPSLLTCDTYWAHVHTLLTKNSPKGVPICVWNPHEWFVVGRQEVEKDVFKTYEQQGAHVFFTVGGHTDLDKEFKRTWETKLVTVNLANTLSLPINYYLNIFGDFIVEVFIDRKLADEIENFYREHTNLTAQHIKIFEDLISKKHPVRMKISRRKKKAALLRKQLSKDFYLPADTLRI